MSNMTYSEKIGMAPCPCVDCLDRDQCGSCVIYCDWLEERKLEIINNLDASTKMINRILAHYKERR